MPSREPPAASTGGRYSRQVSIFNPLTHPELSSTVIGVGAVGRQVAMLLASLGGPTLTLIDPDTVEEANLSSQGYYDADRGAFKVDATTKICEESNREVRVVPVVGFWGRLLVPRYDLMNHRNFNAWFACVDNMRTRRQIFEDFKEHEYQPDDGVRIRRSPILIDARVQGEAFYLHTVTGDDAESHRLYEASLYGDDEVQEGPCSSKMVRYCATIAAGLMVSYMTRWGREIPPPYETKVNLLTNVLHVRSEQPELVDPSNV